MATSTATTSSSPHAPLCVYGEAVASLATVPKTRQEGDIKCVVYYELPQTMPELIEVYWYSCMQCFRTIGANGTMARGALNCPLCDGLFSLAHRAMGYYESKNFLNSPEALGKAKAAHDKIIASYQNERGTIIAVSQKQLDKDREETAWARWSKDVPDWGVKKNNAS